MPKAKRSPVVDYQALDVERMQQLNQWPRWPWLPLKKPKGDGAMPDFACMHADHTIDGKPRVYEGVNVFEVKVWQPTPEMKYTEYDSLEAIVAAGWQID